ncbi:MAG: propanediol dehydratase small subunit [Candidatus Paceibacteria bacterium]
MEKTKLHKMANVKVSRHSRTVKGYDGSLEDLAIDVGNMTYDQTAKFIDHLSKDLRRQAEGDRGRGRPRLAQKLDQTANYLEYSKNNMDLAWNLCVPYMHSDDLSD